jgi:hypothetical protein
VCQSHWPPLACVYILTSSCVLSSPRGTLYHWPPLACVYTFSLALVCQSQGYPARLTSSGLCILQFKFPLWNLKVTQVSHSSILVSVPTCTLFYYSSTALRTTIAVWGTKNIHSGFRCQKHIILLYMFWEKYPYSGVTVNHTHIAKTFFYGFDIWYLSVYFLYLMQWLLCIVQ